MNNKKGGFGAKLVLVLILMIASAAAGAYGYRVMDGKMAIRDAKKAIEDIEALGYGNLPICVAKTQYSLSDDPKKLGAPSGYRLTVREVRVSAGAGFVVVLTGEVMTMPGLPLHPAAEKIDLTDGKIVGLF